MNGIHDMGGMQDMGPVQPEKNEPVFHAGWEARTFALNFAVPGEWPYSQIRLAIESIPPIEYLRMSYYERWLVSLIEVMVRNDLVTRAELESGMPAPSSGKPPPALTAAEIDTWFRPAPPANRPSVPAARFQPKTSVRARNINPAGHTRLPRYVRGKRGTIDRDFGVFPFPDTSAHGQGDKPQHVYSVRFAARELWGDQVNPRDSLYVDLWEDYLEPV